MSKPHLAAAALVIAFAASALRAQDDPYEAYVKNSRDFKPVKQDAAWALKAWPSWTYMPWTYQWSIGYTDESGKWSLASGYNGAFIDWDRIESETSKTGKLDWINQFKLRFYVDHTAAKRYLHLWDGNDMRPHANAVHGPGVRIKPANAAMGATLKGIISKHVGAVKSSPYRAAYALDDEISWGHFVHPCMWQVTDDRAAYDKWLEEIYGPGKSPRLAGWITYNEIWPKLMGWSVASFDASQLMDQWSFNDSYWNNFLGELVEHTNSVDPATPCGFVGGQNPSPFGGYDYAKIMRKIQFIEAYNMGSSQAIIRSFNPGNALPAVTTHFHKAVHDTVWQTWYYLAHGNRGFIGWVENWFDKDKKPQPWHAQVAPTFLEADNKIGPLMSGATWIHDGVAIYYSHPSIQLGWIMDAEAHGKTWINRNNDHKLGSSHLVRQAWENMLRDEGIQYNYINYVDVIQKGIPSEYKVLILPACLALSDAEANQIKKFCRSGGVVIADYMPALWDQHGKGRPAGGALDDIFAVKHDTGAITAADVFGGKLWCETDQDANFGYKTYDDLLTKGSGCIKDASGFNKAVRNMQTNVRNEAARQAGDPTPSAPVGNGTAVLMNLSPQWYNAYRASGFSAARDKRQVFMQHVKDAGAKPWVRIANADQKTHGYEITYWKDAKASGRTIMFVCYNPELSASSVGGGNSIGLKTDTLPITLQFSAPVKNARDERTGKALGDGKEFKLDWKQDEAVVIVFHETTASGRGLEEVRPIRRVSSAHGFSLREGPLGQEGESKCMIGKVWLTFTGNASECGGFTQVLAEGLLRVGASAKQRGSTERVPSAKRQAVRIRGNRMDCEIRKDISIQDRPVLRPP
jgi:hypothetical protein